MTILPFPTPAAPSSQAVLEVVCRLSAAFPRWSIECLHGDDDGRPYVEAICKVTGAVLGAHWDAGHWATLTEDFRTVARSTDLMTALERALA